MSILRWFLQLNFHNFHKKLFKNEKDEEKSCVHFRLTQMHEGWKIDKNMTTVWFI